MKVEIEDKEFMELLLSVKEKTKEIDALKAKVKDLEENKDINKVIADAVERAIKNLPTPAGFYPVPVYYPVYPRPYYYPSYPAYPNTTGTWISTTGTSVSGIEGICTYNGNIEEDICGCITSSVANAPSMFTSSVGDNLTLTFGTWSTPDTEVMYGVS